MSSSKENERRLREFDEAFNLKITRMDEHVREKLKQRWTQKFDEYLRKAELYMNAGDDFRAWYYRDMAQKTNELLEGL